MAFESEIVYNQLVLKEVPENDNESLDDIGMKLGEELNVSIPTARLVEITNMEKKKPNNHCTTRIHMTKKSECKNLVESKKKKKLLLINW